MVRLAKYRGVYPRVLNALDQFSSGSLVPGARRITAQEIEEARRSNPRCKCDLFEGMEGLHLRKLGSGCTGSRPGKDIGWVCPTLDRLRRKLNG